MKKLPLLLTLSMLTLTACDQSKTGYRQARRQRDTGKRRACFRRHLQRRAALRQLRRD